jgi:hypothetical protein
MNKLFALASVLVLACSAADAMDDSISAKVTAAFGNTVLSVYPDGRSQKIWLQPDGAWTGRSRRGNPLAGRWTVKGDKVCLKQTSPMIPFVNFCQVLPDDPETGIDSKDLTGAKIHLKLVKGHVTQVASLPAAADERR